MKASRLAALLAVLALSIFGLAACGSDDDDGGDDSTSAETTTEETTTEASGGGGAGGGGAAISLASPADGSFAYDTNELTAAAGTVTINYDNPSPLSHDVIIEDESGEELGGTDLVAEGSTSAEVDLQPGTYTFFCDVPSHREGGMEGTLTVE